jgi:hypothetical protein
MSISESHRLTSILTLSLILMSPSIVAAADRCAADLQKEYGKYYACALKAQSRATQNGSSPDLRRCRASLEKKISRLTQKHGLDCVVENPLAIVDVADECVQEITDLTTGIEPAPGPDDVSVCSNGLMASNVLARPGLAAKNPPQVEAMTVTPLGSGRARFDVTFAETGAGQCLPTRIPVFSGDRQEVELVSENGRRTFSSEISIESEEWQRYTRELAKASVASGPDMVPVFDGRVQRDRGVPPTAPITFLTGDTISRPISLPLSPAIAPAIVDPERTLMVNDVLVVEDPARTFDPCDPVGTPMGPWTFGYLMQEMANEPSSGILPADLVLEWMDQWTTVQAANGQTIPARVAMQDFIDRWLAESAAAGAPAGQLDLSIAPFRLMAIVNRVDLRENASYGGGNCGEGRFVFGLLNTDTCNPEPFTVIFEYGVNMNTCSSCKGYASDWLDLQNHPMGSPNYLAELEALTHVFTDRNTNPGEPNGSSINQVRTNENALTSPWELREFNLENSGLLGHVTAKQNPIQGLNNTTALASWVSTELTSICAAAHTVPDTFAGSPFLAAHVPYNAGDFFDFPGSTASIQNLCARFELSLNSCSGCHARETNTLFTHVGAVGTRQLGQPAQLSGFLTGAAPANPVSDPVGVSAPRTFNDLARRQIDLWNAANVPCLPAIAFQPLRAVH